MHDINEPAGVLFQAGVCICMFLCVEEGGEIGILEYSRMNVSFPNIGGVILKFY